MSLLLVSGKPEEVKEEVANVLTRKLQTDLKSISESKEHSQIEIRSEAEYADREISITAIIFPYNSDYCILNLSLTLKIFSQLSLAFKAIAFIILSFYIVFIFLKRALYDPSIPIRLRDIAAVGLFYFFGLTYVRVRARLKKILVLAENEFCSIIKRRREAKLLSPINPSPMGSWLSLAVNFILFIFVLLSLFNFLKLLFFITLPFAVLIILHLALSSISKRDAVLALKMQIAELNYKWLSANFYIILIFMCLYYLNILFFCELAKAYNKTDYSMKNCFSVLYFKPAFERSTADFPKENAEMIRKIVLKRLESGRFDSSHPVYKITYKIIVVSVCLLLLVVTFGGIILLLKKYNEIAKTADDWRLMTLGESVVYVKPPSYFKKERWKRLVLSFLVVGKFVASLPINYLAAFIGTDAFLFAVFNKTYIFKNSAILLSWIPANLLALSEMINLTKIISTGYGHLMFISKLIILALALPLMAMILRSALNVIYNMINNFYYFMSSFSMKKIIPESLNKFINEVAVQHDISKPKIKVRNSRKVEVNTQVNLFLAKPVINISRPTLTKLKENELKAVIAHEIGHIKKGLRKIALAKLLSRVALYPNYFLSILFDFAEMEYEADRFSVEATKDKASLKSALIKMSVLSALSKKGKVKTSKILPEIAFCKKISGYLRRLSAVDKFFFGNVLMGYTYPFLMERIKQIENY